jgi:hypothetical protein
LKLTSKLPIWLLIIPLLLLSSGFIISQLGADSLSDGEKNSVKHLVNFGQRFTLLETIKSVNRTSPEHVPAFHLQLSLWADFVGLHFVVLRAMSLFYFVLSVAMIYRFTADLLGEKNAFFASFIVAFSGFSLDHGHNIRMYTMVMVQVIGIFWSYWRIALCPKPTRMHHMFTLLYFSVFGIYTHIILIFPLLSIGFYHVFFAPKIRSWFYVVGVEVLAGMAFLPWFSSAVDGAVGFENLVETHQSFIDVLLNSAFIYSNGFSIGALLLSGLVIWKFPKTNMNFRFISIVFVVMAMAMLIFNELMTYIPARRMRYTIIWLPSLAMLWGYGMTILFQYRRVITYSLLVIWVVMFAWFSASDELYFFSNLQRAQFRDHLPLHLVGEQIKNQYDRFLGRDDSIVFFDSVFDYQKNLLNYYETLYDRKIEYLSFPITEEHMDRLNKIDNSFPGFWFSYRPADREMLVEWQSDERAQDIFDKYVMCLTAIDNTDVNLTYYMDVHVPCDLVTASNQQIIEFNNGYRLRNAVVEYRESEVAVSLWWDSIPEFIFDNSFGFSIQVFRGNEKVGQTDYPVDNVVTHNVVTLSDAMAGMYSVRMILYSADDVKSVGGERGTGVIFERDI